MSPSWAAVVASSALAFALKLLGYLVPAERLERPWIARVLRLLPVALLAALVVVQTVSDGRAVVADARLAGVGAAVVALSLRAPFIVVVVLAAVVAALARAAGWR